MVSRHAEMMVHRVRWLAEIATSVLVGEIVTFVISIGDATAFDIRYKEK